MQSEMEMKGVPPPYPGHPPPPHPPVVATQPVVVEVSASGVPAVMVVNHVGPKATNYTCRSCNTQITTRVQRTRTMRTHLFALLLCVVGCLPCVCLPYCMDSCHDMNHFCPNCDAYIGTYVKQ